MAHRKPRGQKERQQPIPSLQPLGRQIRRLRVEQNIVRELLAYQAGFSPQYLGDVELGRVNPGIETLIALARVLGVTVSKLVETTGDNALPEPPPLPRTRASRRLTRR